MRNKEVSIARSKLANSVKKSKKADDDSVAVESVRDARRALAEAKIKAFVEKTVSEAPELTSDQRDRLASLLHGAGANS